MKTFLMPIAIIVLAVLAVSCANGAVTSTPTLTPPPVVTYDFDTGSPPLSARRSNTPFEQTSGGVMAHFSSPSDPAAFSFQSHDTTFFSLSQFSGNYLYDSDPFRNSLDIRFSHPLTSITLTFATTDSHGPGNVEEPSYISLTAYTYSTATIVGTASARGGFSSDSFPQGTLVLDSGGKPFNNVKIEILFQPRGGTNFFVDNIMVTTLP